MSRDLIIVESPAKAKTIEKFLGRRKARVVASMGHVRDLPRSQFGVDIDGGFEPKYITIRGKGKVLTQLRKEVRKAERVLLATDPDREGEAIAWHLTHALDLDPEGSLRIVFHEITRDAVRSGVKQPRTIDPRLVDAQQARRVLDRIVGYKLSPFLWRKVRRGLSAGRVQSVAMRLVCDREGEIRRFEPQEYWSLTARLSQRHDGSSATFEARYYGEGKERRDLGSQSEMMELLRSLEGASFRVSAVERKDRRRNPAVPFTTSTLQQEAARKLGFNVRRTMRAAQQLYEGLQIRGEGNVGLITYMRTDSTRLAPQAVGQAAGLVRERYGEQYSRPRRYEKKRAGAQDAHEAIRPTSFARHPDALKEDLRQDQYRLYRLIWERALASQMSPAVLDTVSADIAANGHTFRATGSRVKFPGFMVVYIEGSDEKERESQDKALPPLGEGDALDLLALDPKQHFTQPPPRYTEAMLVKALEENGIGRPSTYAPIIETIQERGYVRKQKNRFVPTELGSVVVELLREHFPDIVDVEFTAQLEAELDRIEEREQPWRQVLEQFYQPFQDALEQAEEQVERVELEEQETDEQCENCGRHLVVKYGRYGRFLACPGYPDCKFTKPYLEKTGASCPQCGGDVVVRRSRKGRTFYGCSTYPACEFVTWYRPTQRSCPRCGTFLVQRRTKARGTFYQCARKDCDHEEAPVQTVSGQPDGRRSGRRVKGDGRAGRSDAEKRLARMAAEVVRSAD